jgi:uncharacterized integral membrane protein
MGTHIKALLLIALLFLAITFGTQNSGSVTLRYYFDIVSIPLPLYLVIYLALILGIISGLAIDLYSRVILKRRAKQLGKANESLRGELDKLKSETGEDAKEKSDLVPAESGPDQTQVLPPSPPAQTDDE